MWSSNMLFAPSSSDGATQPIPSARCGGHQISEVVHLSDSVFFPNCNGKRSDSSPAEQEPDELTAELHSKVGDCSRNMRKSTACETELDISGEASRDVSQKGISPLGFELKKPSLLQGLRTPGERQIFESFVLEVDDDERSFETHQVLGKRTESTPVQANLDNQPEKLRVVGSRSTNEAVEVSKCRYGHRTGARESEKVEAQCEICENQLQFIRSFIMERGGKLLSQSLDEELEVECDKGHQWKVSAKKATKSWCKECKKKRKQVLKDMLREEATRKEEELKDKQQKLLEEARQRMLHGEQQVKQDELETFKIILEEITRIASKYAREYCQKDSQASFEQSLLLYQTLILPDKNLLVYFNSLSKDELKKEFRRYSIMLHPDKNNHPKAKQAFQKAYNLFSSLLIS